MKESKAKKVVQKILDPSDVQINGSRPRARRNQLWQVVFSKEGIKVNVNSVKPALSIFKEYH